MLDESRQADLLQKFFDKLPSAEALLVFSARRAAKGAKMPLFAIVENCSFDNLKKFMKHYFPETNSQNAKNLYDLLELKNENGQRLDYHYFEKSLPEDVVAQTREAFEMPQIETLWRPEEYRKYNLLRNLKMQAVNKYNAEHPNFLRLDMMRQTPKDTLPLSLRFYPTEENPIIVPFVAAGPIKPENPWLEQAFGNIDYPEIASWSVSSIKKIEKEYEDVKNDGYFNSIAQNFLDLSEIMICNTYRDEDGKDETGMEYAGEAGMTELVDDNGLGSSWYTYTHYADSKLKGSVFAHEATHIADMSVDELITENNFTHQACKLAYLNRGASEFRSKIVHNIVRSYKPKQFETEMCAYATEVYMDRKNKKDVLLRAASKMLATYVAADGDDNQNAINYMRYAQNRIPHQEELEQLEKIYKRQLSKQHLSSKNGKPVFLKNKEGIEKISEICAQSGGLEKIERDVSAYMLQTLRVVNFINNNPELKNSNKLKPQDFEKMFLQKIGRKEKSLPKQMRFAAKRTARE